MLGTARVVSGAVGNSVAVVLSESNVYVVHAAHPVVQDVVTVSVIKSVTTTVLSSSFVTV